MSIVVKNNGLWVLAIMLVPSQIYMLIFFKTRYNRKEIEENRKENSESITTKLINEK